MQARSFLILAALVVAVVAAVVVVVARPAPELERQASVHGQFVERFQPAMPSSASAASVDRERQASIDGIGSIRQLQPVDLTRQQ